MLEPGGVEKGAASQRYYSPKFDDAAAHFGHEKKRI
jgi:hypothetical protein